MTKILASNVRNEQPGRIFKVLVLDILTFGFCLNIIFVSDTI